MAKIAEVQEVAIENLRPYERNAKTHDEEQIRKIAESITEFGFISPCLIDRYSNIIAGHGRVMAAKRIGMQTVPCICIEGLTEAQRKAYILCYMMEYDAKYAEVIIERWEKETGRIAIKEKE